MSWIKSTWCATIKKYIIMRKLYFNEIEKMGGDLINCDTIEDLSNLGFNVNDIIIQSLKPAYYTFRVPKRNGKMRTIEAPKDALKAIQRRINRYLQCVYYLYQSSASHGYIITSKKEKNPKNILENAKKHLGMDYLLNVDFKDFFHQFRTDRVKSILTTFPFQFDKKSANILAQLLTFRGRLPMGTPTSPVISNLGTMAFDNEVSDWSQANNITYTRFVDDLSFSSHQKITISHLSQIENICYKHGLKINPDKIKNFGPSDTKKVTGLLLRETVDVDDSFYEELNKDLERLKYLAEVNLILQKDKSESDFREFKQQVQGQINFIGMIEGYDNTLFYKYRMKLKDAINPKESILSARWTNINYM